MMREELDAIKARERAATPGPWHVRDGFIVDKYNNFITHLGTGAAFVPDHSPEQIAANSKLIAHSRTDVPTLIAEVERLTGELEVHKYFINTVSVYIKQAAALLK